jgi:hypothetical protein
MTATLDMNLLEFEGFEELGVEGLLSVDGGMTLGELLLRTVCAVAGGTYFGVKGANVGYNISGGNPYVTALGGAAGGVAGGVWGWNLGGNIYNSMY